MTAKKAGACRLMPIVSKAPNLSKTLSTLQIGKVAIEAGKKVTARTIRDLDGKVKDVRVTAEALNGRYLSEDIVNMDTGEIYFEAGDELTYEIDEKTGEASGSVVDLVDMGYDSIDVLDIDHVNIGAYIRYTLAADKNHSRQDALFDIYRVMRPGEPPTLETAEAMFQSLFFDRERYDLSAVGRVKMNMRLDLDAEDTVRVCARKTSLQCENSG